MEELGAEPGDFTHAVFHQPNTNSRRAWPSAWALRTEQIEPGLLSGVIGNTYAGAALTGFSAVLDVAEPGDRVLLVCFGSGAGSDAFAWEITDEIVARRERAPKVQDYIARRHRDRLRDLCAVSRKAIDGVGTIGK